MSVFLFLVCCLYCVFSFCNVLCIVSTFVYSCLFTLCVQVYRPLPPGGNTTAVNIIYHTKHTNGQNVDFLNVKHGGTQCIQQVLKRFNFFVCYLLLGRGIRLPYLQNNYSTRCLCQPSNFPVDSVSKFEMPLHFSITGDPTSFGC